MKLVTIAAAWAVSLAAGPVLAAHNNPWAEEGDDVLAQYHDVNQQQSIGTPGEDEMLGLNVRAALGKLEGSAPGVTTDASESAGRSATGGAGGAGHGGAGGGQGDGNGGGRR